MGAQASGSILLSCRTVFHEPASKATRSRHTADTGHWVCHQLSPKFAANLESLLFRIKVHFKDSKGNHLTTVEGSEGDDILSLAHEHDIDLEGMYPNARISRSPGQVSWVVIGACEGSVACSTCLVILSEQHYGLLPEPEVC